MNLIDRLIKLGLFLATAESLTGGLLSGKLIDTPGASQVVLGGIVAYQDAVKQNLLGVQAALIGKVGVIDSEVAVLMATSVRQQFAQADSRDPDLVIGISSTGVAGPLAVGDHKVGEVLIGISSSRASYSRKFHFQGDRAQIREQSVNAALLAVREHLDEFWGLESGNNQIS